MLNNAWEGYHTCLFAYGQTGSGKSHSMIGYGVNKGIVPQACEEMFRRIGENTDKEKSFQVTTSMLQIYNEKIEDLFVEQAKRPKEGLKIRESSGIGVYVEGAQEVAVSSFAEIERYMNIADKNRTVAATLMNQTSSRAHTVITIKFKQIINFNGKKSEKSSVINLVDLAGSEKSSKTGTTGINF